MPLPPLPLPQSTPSGSTPSETRIKEISANMGYSAQLAHYLLERNEAFIDALLAVATDDSLEADVDLTLLTQTSATPPSVQPTAIVEPALPAVTVYGAPAAPVLPEPTPATRIVIPDNDAVLATLNLPNTPSPVKPTLPTAPVLNDVDLPPEPTLPVFVAPTFSAIEIPDAPELQPLGVFDEDFPVADFLPPAAEFVFDEIAYTSALNDIIRSKLTQYINEGGTGLSEVFESAVYDRARVRAVEATRKAIDEIDDNFAAAGWPTPPGSRDARQRRRLRDHLNSELEIIDKILIQQTQLAHEWGKFTLQTGVTFEDVMIRHFNAVADRAVLAARATVDTAIAVYNARVANYNVQLEKVKIAAEIYLTKIKANSQQIELYRAILQGKETEGRINEVEASVFNAQIAGNRALVDVYGALMDGAKVKTEIERNKVIIFGEQITAYRAQLEGNVAEYSAYKAGIDGELAKVTVFTAELDAYKAKLNTLEVESKLREAEANEKIQIGKMQTALYQVQVAAHGANVASYQAAVQHGVALLGSRTDRYKAEASKIEAQARVDIKHLEIKLAEQQFNTTIKNHEILQVFKNLETIANIKTAASEGAAKTLGSIAGSALSQYTSIAQVMSSVETITEDAPATT